MTFPIHRFVVKLVALGLAFILGAAHAVQAQDRWALVLAVGEYDDPQIPDLNNTINDGRTMASVLNQMGFRVYYAENSTKEQFDDLLARVIEEQADAELGMFYFAGHGLQVGGENLALPSDLSADLANSLASHTISVGSVVSQLNETGVKNLVVILDACRNSPFTDQGAAGTGLALVDAPDNTIIAYSTAPGEVALDGVGANSPYTAALATALEGPESDIRDALRLVRARVRLATGGAQTPWYVDNSRGEILVRPPLGDPQTPELTTETGEISLETTAWWTIANSADPRDYQSFLNLFPEAPQAASAERQLTLLGDAPEFPLLDLGLPIENAEVPGGLNSFITACDVLATSSDGGMGIVESVSHDLINVRSALRACTEAVRADPENPRLLGLLAWVLFLDDRYTESLHYYREAAQKGHPGAWGGIANFYRRGIAVPQDLERAAEAIRTGALAGSDELRVAMGIYYREGWGVPQSFNEARRWFELGVLGGEASAMTAIGDMYRRGQLGDDLADVALGFYEKAATLEHSDAMNNIGMAYMRGEGVAQDTNTGIAWLSRASDLGNPYAPFHLGRAFLTGWGVDKDPTQALAFFRLSAQRNFLGAYIFVGDALRAQDNPDLTEALANYIIAREAGIERDTRKSREEAAEAEARIAEVKAEMSAEQIAAGEEQAATWIAQYGLLDFNLVHQ